MQIFRIACRVSGVVIRAAGIAFILLLALCFTSIPWSALEWLASDAEIPDDDPAYIVVLGGGGIPSESGLMRTYYAAEAGHRFPRARLIVALPEDGPIEGSPLGLMAGELILRGIEPSRILYESEGTNTRYQALMVKKMLEADGLASPMLIVTSPEHMKRSLLAFRKVGFTRVAGYAAHATAAGGDLTYDEEDVGGGQAWTPSLGDRMLIRYGFWNHLGYLNRFVREICALTYYKVRGWI